MPKRIALLLLLMAAGLCAQTRPDFNGLWRQNNERCTPKRTSSGFDYSNRIAQSDLDLKVTTITKGDRGERSYDRAYKTDGSEQISKDAEGDEFHTRVSWELDKLVFDTVEKDRAGTITTTETWTLIDSGKTLKKVRRTSGPRGDSEVTYILEKQ
jgi:hypothetical protein